MLRRILFAPDAPAQPSGGGSTPASAAPAAAATPAPVAAPTTDPKAASTPAAAAAPVGDGEDEFLAEARKIGGEPDAAPKPDVTPTPQPGVKPKPDATLNWKSAPEKFRVGYEKVQADLTAAQSELTSLRSKVAESGAKAPETAALVQERATLQKTIEDLRAEVRAYKQEAAPEFKAKYDEPFNRLAERAKTVVEKMTLTNDAGETSPASWQNFQQLYHTDEANAEAAAVQLFGEHGAKTAMRYYYDLHRLDESRATALNEERSHWQEKQKAEQAQEAARREETQNLLTRISAEIAESVPEYHNDPTDKDLTAARTKGLQLFDAEPKTIQQSLMRAAHIRQIVGSFFAQKFAMNRLTQELATVKAENEKLRAVPGGQSRPAITPAEDDGEWNEDKWAAEARSKVGAA